MADLNGEAPKRPKFNHDESIGDEPDSDSGFSSDEEKVPKHN